MTHPAIPPGCEFFLLRNDGEVHFVWFCGYPVTRHMINLSDPNPTFPPDMRKIIAAVAEVAWIREMERFVDRILREASMENMESYANAEANARAWRGWGEKGDADEKG